MKPDALTGIEADAQSFADGKTTELELFNDAIAALPGVVRGRIAHAIGVAFKQGAAAGYLAAREEHRK